VIAIFLCADVGMCTSSLRHRVLAFSVLIISGITYYEFLFEGFGRLVLGSIACGVAAIASYHAKTYVPKCLLLLGSAPAIAFLAAQRLEYLGQIRTSPVGPAEGIGSVVEPFVSFCKILDALRDGQLSPSWGSSFFATAVIWVPRSLWANKPVGFGSEIIPITQPSLVGAHGYSDAATFLGELFWNTGALAVLALGALALLIKYADRLAVHAAASTASDDTLEKTLARIMVVALTSTMVNYVWGGSFTLAGRAIPVMSILLLWWSGIHLFRRKRSTAPLTVTVTVTSQLYSGSKRLSTTRRKTAPFGAASITSQERR